ncbi:Protein fmp32, mitochondrial [Coemansia sp. RSA 2711]|nr:Protein fmp32, mitochondrial [Coemansia sp. RSA 2711]
MEEFRRAIKPGRFALNGWDMSAAFTNIPYIYYFKNTNSSLAVDFMPSSKLRASFLKTLEEFPILVGHVKTDADGRTWVDVNARRPNMPEYLESHSTVHFCDLESAGYDWNAFPGKIATVGAFPSQGPSGTIKLANDLADLCAQTRFHIRETTAELIAEYHHIINKTPAMFGHAMAKGITTVNKVVVSNQSRFSLYQNDFGNGIPAWREGFSKQQSESIVTSVNAVLSESTESILSNIVTKAEQDKTLYMYKVDFAQLKSEIQMMEKTDFSMMKAENERLQGEVNKLKQKLREEITRTQAGVRLDMSLEKGRARDEQAQHEIKIRETDAKIEQEISGLRTQMESIKFSILQYMIGTITGTGALILAYLRMFK